MIPNNRITASLLFVILLAASSIAFSADGAVTFESFYRAGFSVNWVMAGLSALVIGILVFMGLPVIAPTMAVAIGTIGTSVGSLFGLSGVAATNAGLALLGAGAIASGGFGVIGGTALLASAITFGTDVTLDYALGSLQSNYEAKKFGKESLTMVTLPLPKNFDGPPSVKAVGKALDSQLLSNSWSCITQFPTDMQQFKNCLAASQPTQRQLVQYAIAALEATKGSTFGVPAQERETAMYALLQFLNNNYVEAGKAAFQAYKLGISRNDTPTLPAFILAASMLYEDNPDFSESLTLFQYAITAEPANPLTSVLFAVYLDRITYRLNDGAAAVDHIDRLSILADGLANDDRKLVIQQELLSRSVMQIKLVQQKILSITRTQNEFILENPRALAVVKGSLRDYKQFVTACAALIARQDTLLSILGNNTSLMGRLTGQPNPYTDNRSAWPVSMNQFSGAIAGYEKGQQDLETRIANFEKQQAEAIAARKAKEDEEAKKAKAKEDEEAEKAKAWPIFDWVRRLFR